MSPRIARRSASHRDGFTLVEMLIVLAIVVVLLAACWPRLRLMVEKAELQEAAKALRTAIARGRLDAIDSGTPRQCRYQPGGKLYEVSVFRPGGDELLGGTEIGPPVEPPAQFALPHGIRFARLPSADANSSGETAGEWSDPVVLYPNGRSANARFRLAGAKHLYVDVVLRGIVGVPQVGRVQQDQQEDTPP
jgi:prepilin-type N-terminal cleavage/methylation domain-containing protein